MKLQADAPAKCAVRDESTPEGRRIWADVDKAASRAPDWIKQQFGPHETICSGCGGDGTHQNPYSRTCALSSEHPQDPRYIWNGLPFTSRDDESERSEFEVVMRDRFDEWQAKYPLITNPLNLKRADDGDYISPLVTAAWIGWQAACRRRTR